MSLGARSMTTRAMCVECMERPALVMMTTIRPRYQRDVEIKRMVRVKNHLLCQRCYRDLQNRTQGRA